MKTITIRELIKILEKNHDDIEDTETYKKFILHVATVVTDHFGGDFDEESIRFDTKKKDWVVNIKRNICIPSGKTVYHDYDRSNKL